MHSTNERSEETSHDGSHVSYPREDDEAEQLSREVGTCSWDQLQEKYTDAMNEHTRTEENLRLQVTQLLQVLFLT